MHNFHQNLLVLRVNWSYFFKACILPINSRINEGKLNVRSSFNFTRRSVMVENCLSPISAGPNEPEPELPKLGLFPFPPWPWCLFFRLLINTGSSSKTGVFWSKYNCRPAKKSDKKVKKPIQGIYYFYFNVGVKILNWQNWDIFIIYTLLIANHTFFSANIFSSIAKHVILVHEDNRAFWKVIPFFVLF